MHWFYMLSHLRGHALSNLAAVWHTLQVQIFFLVKIPYLKKKQFYEKLIFIKVS